jgi:hypothetical protein
MEHLLSRANFSDEIDPLDQVKAIIHSDFPARAVSEESARKQLR